MTAPATPLQLRRRWTELRHTPAVLRICLLSGYTIDPLVPYLGTRLHDAGLPAHLSVGPLNQIAAQCLDDRGDVARERPDVLVVAPYGESRADLLELADITRAAAARWSAFLVFVLPALPGTAPLGAGEPGDPGGATALAVAAREAARSRLAGTPWVGLADMENVVRAIGVRNAEHPAMNRYAMIPYTEQAYARLGYEIGALLRARFGGVVRALVLDLDTIGRVPPEDTAVLRAPLRTLHEAGVRLAVRAGDDLEGTWPVARSVLGDLCPEAVDDWVVDSRPLDAQLRDLAESLSVDPQHLALATTGPDFGSVAGETVVALGEIPDGWPAELATSGVFDRLPVPPGKPDGTTTAGRPVVRGLDEYIAGLGVELAWLEPAAVTPARVAEMLVRTKEFTLGVEYSATQLADPAGIAVARVRDRLGDYGPSVAIRYSSTGDTCRVDVFLVSCPVLGKAVEDAVLESIIDRADRAGATTVVFPLRETGRNQLTAQFLHGAADRSWTSRSGRPLRVRVEPVGKG